MINVLLFTERGIAHGPPGPRGLPGPPGPSGGGTSGYTTATIDYSALMSSECDFVSLIGIGRPMQNDSFILLLSLLHLP